MTGFSTEFLSDGSRELNYNGVLTPCGGPFRCREQGLDSAKAARVGAPEAGLRVTLHAVISPTGSAGAPTLSRLPAR